MPAVSNHWLLMGITALGLLPIAATRAVRGEPGDAWFESVRPVIGSQLLLLYAFATLAKLNAGFFDPTLSCASAHYAWLVERVPFLPSATTPWIPAAAMAGTLLAEGGLPLLLLFRRTRMAGVFGVWSFHLVLGVNGFYDFSSVAAAYAATFLPARTLEGWGEVRGRVPVVARVCRGAERFASSRLGPSVAVASLLLLALAPVLAGTPPDSLRVFAFRLGRVVWLPLWLALGAALLLAWRHAPAGEPERVRRRPPLLAWLAPALVVANGLSPYLGLKTENSFAMYSNLQTEGGQWNHALLPESLRVFPFQDEPVRILGSSDPTLRQYAEQRLRIVPFALRVHLRDRPGASVRYEAEGRVRNASRAALDGFLAAPVNPALAKLFQFRPVPGPRRNSCRH